MKAKPNAPQANWRLEGNTIVVDIPDAVEAPRRP
jgi:hypothetical protein